MRKDTRLGMFMGGGVLIALLAGSIVLFHKNKSPHGVETTPLMAEGSSGVGELQTQPSDEAATKPPETTAKIHDAKPSDPVSSQPEKTTDTPIAKAKSDPIGDLLMHGGNEPMVTRNPEPTGTSELPGASAAPAGEQAPVVPIKDATLAPAPATQPIAGKAHTHMVQKGETFSTIAAAAYGSANFYPYIMRANPNVDAKALKVNMVINLPDISEVKVSEKTATTKPDVQAPSHKIEQTIDAKTQYRVVSGDSLHKIALKLYGKVAMADTLYEANKDTIGTNPAALKIGMVLKLPQPPVAPVTTLAR